MLPSSVRRVVATTAPQAGGLASSLACTAPKAAAASAATTATPFFRGHQRRCSSSKPSSSNNGSSPVPPATADEAVQARGHGKTAGEKRKRKSAQRAMKQLPSVPSTHHMAGEALGLSSFFSLHRPISITQTMPRSITDEQFAAIFASRSKASKMSDAMATLSSTIDQLEGPMGSMSIGQDPQPQDHMQSMQVRNADGSESSIYVQVDHMSGDFLPFRPPPLPQPQPNLEADTAAAAEAEAADADAAHHRSYKAMFTIEENTEANGEIRIVAHSPQILNGDEQPSQQPRSFVQRLAQRQLKFEDAQSTSGRDMYGLSVLRRRRLRMKKKKYKKLMKRTRNERRKLDRN
ncbi:uncharacterized protein F5Z01DRAFT_536836 [Emericellopsis atlantica]|uniref:Small ribosomal subunit protein mS38 n=1 Tax=Emericellopsis atlantica TaxID=2614577 RepID=A0A9P7ZPS1_9HYPO|nr:uncharacterized protein F5Z01DRAFT_536836 [Emericellopsis atlantica]KAG9256069.1 hypothetical protein F5Z01DRAFT_536836 [Emericellopsis atlantica]